MEPGANIDAEWPDLLGNAAGAADASGRAVEGGKNAVACAFNLIAAEALEIAPDSSVMTVKQVTPAVVADRNSFLSRADDVCKQYRGEHPINRDRRPRTCQEFLDRVSDLRRVLTDERNVVYSWKLMVARA
jgi:hypothetical protein